MVKSDNMVKLITCFCCGKRKPNGSNGLCGKCYSSFYNAATKRTVKKINTNGICCVCGKRKPIWATKMCRKCYNKQYRVKNGLNTGFITKNKKCATYLGCVVAETLLVKVFKNVTWMPVNNPGYDVVCGQGFKIDIKSSCFRLKTGNWQFCLNKNTTPDHFLLLAFDNREKLNPLYALLIPQKDVNGMLYLYIKPSTLHLWDKYRLSIDKTVKCCDSMKGK